MTALEQAREVRTVDAPRRSELVGRLGWGVSHPSENGYKHPLGAGGYQTYVPESQNIGWQDWINR